MPTYSKIKEIKSEARKMERNRAHTIAITSFLAIIALTAAITATILTVTDRQEDRRPVQTPAIVFQVPVAEFGGILKNSSLSELQFNEYMNRWEGHKGVAIASPLGSAVLAPFAGRVTSVRNNTIHGMQVTIEHRDGVRTVLSNLATNTNVTEGQQVNKGQRVGSVGQTRALEFSTTPHVHVQVYRNDRRVDPNDFIDFPAK